MIEVIQKQKVLHLDFSKFCIERTVDVEEQYEVTYSLIFISLNSFLCLNLNLNN